MLVIVDMVNHKIAQALPDNVSVETTEQGRDAGPRVRNTVTHPDCFADTQCRRLTLKTRFFLRLASQWTINRTGEQVIKFWLTQDLSFSSNKIGSDRSIQKRIHTSHTLKWLVVIRMVPTLVDSYSTLS